MLQPVNNSENLREALYKSQRLLRSLQSSNNSPYSRRLLPEKSALPRSPLIKGTTQAEIDLPLQNSSFLRSIQTWSIQRNQLISTASKEAVTSSIALF
jgi:hypothetical protein